MGATLDEIVDGIEGLLRSVEALRVSDTIGPDLPVSGQASVAVVLPPDVDDYRATMGRSKYELDVEVLVLVASVVDRVGQRNLLRYASQTGSKSIRAAVESDPMLGGTCDTSFLKSFRHLGIEEVGVIGYFGGIFTIHLAASGV